ncbi:hypothetical protein M409DRAFT_60432 [Zasmidium cellare ATCC 36951]|uniref:Major facilitator superfamily (MFS) profile domain-containing protein n=1 Tax=Zasmidium cellare ATCC 36951 TaxID=1080233 RepID=A0A6A6BYH0_ZASCE|nr:uncharacterized protein M409DRAFT_60432 [Zasmidium cellare ATCC 36951]KAF2159834.1 hypothetical protein M409DRAFT_60432 [Zasmidium cellare ATCC 36951]
MDPEKDLEKSDSESLLPPLDTASPTTHPKEEIETPTRSSSPAPDLDPTEREAQRTALTKSISLEKRVSLPREILVVGLISLAQFTTQVGLGQTLSILHIIGEDFGIEDPGVLSWLIAGYSLTVGTFILFTGRLGDLFGWKRMFVVGFVWFAVWSMVCGLAAYSNHVLFVFARVFQGIGPAICLPNGLALLGGLYQPGPRKNMAFAIFGACAPGGSIAGSAFAGIFAQLAWWPCKSSISREHLINQLTLPGTFWSFAITLLGIAIVSYLTIPDPQDTKPGIKGKPLKESLWVMDVPGAAIGITALVLFNFAWNQAPIVGWSQAYVIVTLILGVLLVPLFFYIELRISPTPILPIDVFTASNAFVLACIACGWANFGIWVYYFWQILEQLRGATPLLASAYLSPLTLAGIVAAVSTGLLLHKLKPAWVMIGAMAAFLTASILVATLPPFQIYWAQIFVCTVIAPFGMDMSFPSATIVISDSVKKEHQGVAASLVNTIVNYSISLGLGFAGTIEVHVNNGGRTFGDTLHGYRSALYMGIGLSGLGLLLAMVFLGKSYLDEHREKKRQERERGADIKA